MLVNLFDRSFSHTKNLWGYISATGTNIWGKPKEIEYVSGLMEFDGITIFVGSYLCEDELIQNVKSKYKVGWIIEPRDVEPSSYEGAERNNDKFDLIITFDQYLINKFSNCKHLIWCESRIKEENWKEQNDLNKDKLISMIASNKMITEGHRYRHTVAREVCFNNKYDIDLWGNAYRSFADKTEPLEKYYFTILINNSVQENFFTEALCDALVLRTVPIFRGCRNIGNFFDKEGFITFNTTEELKNILDNLTEEEYFKRLKNIENNYHLCKPYKKSVDDQILLLINNELNYE